MLVPLAFVQATLNLGPTSMSLPDLAAALTKGGVPTECSPSLRERAALISLHGRSPEEARKALGEGLGVAFVLKDGLWTMTVDDGARSRERKLLTEYKAHVVRVLRAWQGVERAAREGRTFAAALDKADAAALRLRDGTMTEAQAIRWVAPALAAIRRAQPNTWTSVAALDDSAFVNRAIDSGDATLIVPAAQIEGRTGVPLSAYLVEARKLGADPRQKGDLSVRARYDPLRATLTLSSTFRVGDKYVAGTQAFEAGARGRLGNDRSAYEVTIELEPQEADETFVKMGTVAAAYLRGLAPQPVLPNAPRLSPAPWTLSSALEGLCARGQDIVMELSPRFEYVPRHDFGTLQSPPATFRSLFNPVPLAVDAVPDYGRGAEVAGMDSAAIAAQRARWARRRSPWRVLDLDGIWLVVNPFGFLDRTQWISPVPFLAIEVALREQGGPTFPPLPTIATARRIVRAMPTTRMQTLYEFLDYRDLDLKEHVSLARMVETVDSAPASDAAAFWEGLRRTGEGYLPTLGREMTFRIGEQDAGTVGGYLFPGRAAGGADLGYVKFDGRGSVLP